MGDGTQWASVIEAIEDQEREIRLTLIKWSEEVSSFDASGWIFYETKRRLRDHTRAFGVELKVEEIELQNLASEMKKIKRRGGSKELLSFNCMVGLPHIGRVRRRKEVLQFLKVARELSLCSPTCSTGTNGVITFGDGEDAWEISKKCSSLSAFLDGNVVHYQALLESMEYNFPIHLGEARAAMECLFVAAFVSPLAWIQQWQERKELGDFQSTSGLEGWRLSRESLMEAKEMVREGASPYAVVVEGERLRVRMKWSWKWRGIPLAKVYLWRN